MKTIFAACLVATALGMASLAHAGEGKVLSSLDLSKPFAARSPWRLIATQGPDVDDPTAGPGDKAPGAITLCLTPDDGKTCDPVLTKAMKKLNADDIFDVPHFLLDAHVETLPDGRRFLFVRTGSFLSGDSDQRVITQAFVYDRARDRFVVAYEHSDGHNNNQDVRFVTTGPLRGDLITVESPYGPPFSYVLSVNRLSAKGVFVPILRYRTATRYGDGNGLSVIDSDMPDLLKRLGLWRVGQPLPLPASACAKPHLVKMELWCE